jgi:hypothetical protein
MRHVRSNRLPKLVSIDNLEELNGQLAVITDPAERAAFIKANAPAWSALRTAMWGLNGCKCWYSEAILQEQQGHIEHYRPKNRVAGEDHPGYWWRAFDWTNLRLSHPTVNFRVTDYLTGKLAGKGTYFPLKEGCTRALNRDGEADERPVLLDPTDPGDCRLLCFDLTSGKPIPRVPKDTDPWLHQRAADSIRFYHLDEGTWNVDRKDLIDDVQKLCDQIERHFAGLPATSHDYEAAVDELTEYLGHTAEFSSVALQVVLGRGLHEHVHPVPAAKAGQP